MFRSKLMGSLVFIVIAALLAALALSFVRVSGGSEKSRYEVTIAFAESVSQQDIDEAAALLAAHDRDLDLLVMESFPPIGRALLKSDRDVCDAVRAQLADKDYVREVTCRAWTQEDSGDPDEPVSDARR